MGLNVVTLDGLFGEAWRNLQITILGQKATRCHAIYVHALLRWSEAWKNSQGRSYLYALYVSAYPKKSRGNWAFSLRFFSFNVVFIFPNGILMLPLDHQRLKESQEDIMEDINDVLLRIPLAVVTLFSNNFLLIFSIFPDRWCPLILRFL